MKIKSFSNLILYFQFIKKYNIKYRLKFSVKDIYSTT